MWWATAAWDRLPRFFLVRDGRIFAVGDARWRKQLRARDQLCGRGRAQGPPQIRRAADDSRDILRILRAEFRGDGNRGDQPSLAAVPRVLMDAEHARIIAHYVQAAGNLAQLRFECPLERSSGFDPLCIVSATKA